MTIFLDTTRMGSREEQVPDEDAHVSVQALLAAMRQSSSCSRSLTRRHLKQSAGR